MTIPETALVATNGAFIEQFEMTPTDRGLLDGLTFAVKDVIDVAGHRTGCGLPAWRDTHPPAATSAVGVDLLRAGGATCVGKTVTDTLAFSLLGENAFYGTPRNPRCPDRVPGGSSSGSAAAVASGLCDFALGTDTAGSVRVPAANCGLFGWRPTHGHISVAGVTPLAPSFDTLGVLARAGDILAQVGSVLLGADVPPRTEIGTIYQVTEAFSLVDDDVCAALQPAVARLGEALGVDVRNAFLRTLDEERGGQTGLDGWRETFSVLQWAEVWSIYGGWLESTRPLLDPAITNSFCLTRDLDRRTILSAVQRRHRLCRALANLLGPRDLLCLPTVPSPAPRKGSVGADRSRDVYYRRVLSLTAMAGIARLPQVTLPLGAVDGLPVGLSLMAASGGDALLLSAVRRAAEHLPAV